jgi:chemotaxis methyl-accepting protein methylase
MGEAVRVEASTPVSGIPDLDQVRAFIAELANQLDPQSRYVPELLSYVDAAVDTLDLERRLNAGCRGLYWAGYHAWATMSIWDKLRVYLITNETELMRFDRAEIGFMRHHVLPVLGRCSPARLLSLPCSHGEEAVSLAIECEDFGLTRYEVYGLDIQAACIETAKGGRIPLSGLPRYVLGVIDPVIQEHLSFAVANAFTDPLGGPYQLVVCRNFLGYFRPKQIVALLERLLGVLAKESYLLLDRFILGKHPELFADFPVKQCAGLPYFVKGLPAVHHFEVPAEPWPAHY